MDKKIARKLDKLKERLSTLETELRLSLQKKAAGPAISVAAYTNKIQSVKAEIAALG